MSLKIIDSHRIEDLAADLKGKLLAAKESGGDPFAFVQVVVPNGNVAKWLQMRVFAKEESLCAGIRFPFFEQRMTELMRANLERPEDFDLLPDHAYAHAIMRILLSDGKDPALRMDAADISALAPFRAYVMQGDAGKLVVSGRKRAQMAWQLADKLANLMDTYEVRRPEIVEAWLGKDSDAHGRFASVPGGSRRSGVEAGEAALARALWGDGGVFPDCGNRLSLRQLYDRVKASPPTGPAQTLYFFGQSTLTLLQARILAWLARTHEVILHHNNPCLEYWGDIESAKERRKALFGVGKTVVAAQDPDVGFDWQVDDAAVENPLLTKFGIAGRETLRLLVDLEEEVGEARGFEWTHLSPSSATERATVLSRVQESICKRTSKVEKLPQDASVQVVGTPGIRREVEMVYNSILGSVCRPNGVEGERPWPDCSFSDIAVLVPDMKTYRPVIESVFDARGEVPYGLIDTSAAENSQYLAGFLALMELKRRGLTRETLFAVLDNPCVQAALDFSREDVMGWRELAETLGAFDGFERKGSDDCFCWDWALSRLRLGRVAVSLKTVAGETGDDLPLVMRGDASALRFSEIVESLHRELRESPGDDSCWGEILGRWAKEFLSVREDDRLEDDVRREVMRTLNGLREIPPEQTFELPAAAVEHFVGGIACRKGGCLTHGVTIAGLQSLRPVPFRQVYVMGLGAGGFPGRTSSSSLDVRGTGWRLGDVSLPNANRYLFLETLMSVRDRLVLSYPNRDVEKDAELYPSSIVRELESFIGTSVVAGANGTGEGVGFAEFRGYPLLEHGESGMDEEALGKSSVCAIRWTPADAFAGILPTYSLAARQLARRRNGGGGEDPRKNREWKESPTGTPEYTAKELAEFVRSPMRAVLRDRFGVAVEGYLDHALDSESPLEMPDGPPLWNLQEAWLKDFERGAERAFRDLQLSGGVPMGFLGAYAKEKVDSELKTGLEGIRAFVEKFCGTDAAKATVKGGRHKVAFDGQSVRGERLFSVECPGWIECGNEVKVLVSGHLGDEKKLSAFSPACALEPLMTFAIDSASRADADRAPRTLTVGVVDLKHGTCRAWKWKDVTPDRARNYLATLTADYEGYLGSGRDGKPVALEYGKVVETPHLLPYLRAQGKMEADGSGESGNACEMLLGAVLRETAKDDFRRGEKKAFNNGLVIQKIVDGFASEPDEMALKEWIAGRFSLPLAGEMATDQTGGSVGGKGVAE